MSDTPAMQQVLDYHRTTKHRLDAYARGPETIDWDDQPSPFRRYANTVSLDLDPQRRIQDLDFHQLYEPDRRAPQTLNLEQLGLMLRYSLGLSAWKSYGTSKWSLRCNPSSGNLHPGEAYILVQGMDDLEAGLYHYDCLQHQLVRLAPLASSEALTQKYAHQPLCLLLLTSIPWRESWKYGERAFRYCQLDTGHALASLQFAAASRGWRLRQVTELGCDWAGELLNLGAVNRAHPQEPEHMEAIVQVMSGAQMPVFDGEDCAGLNTVSAPPLPEDLGAKHWYQWPVVEEMYSSTLPCQPGDDSNTLSSLPPLPATEAAADAGEILLQRRSAQHFSPDGSMSRESFLNLLDMTLPRQGVTPWQDWPWAPQISLLLFVHRVEDLAPGLYLLARDPAQLPQLRQHIRDDLPWEPVDSGRQHLQLFTLARASAQRTARTLSCLQDIAADSCFSLAMLARFHDPVAAHDSAYRQLHREAGLIGQVLYLEAELRGLRGTGIGCFFDDAVHELLGLKNDYFQDLYHFTVGLPIVDQRLVSLSGYHHLDSE